MAFISPPSLLRPFPLANFPFLLLKGVADDEDDDDDDGDVLLRGAHAPMRRARPHLQAEVLLVPALHPTQDVFLHCARAQRSI